MSLHPLLNPNCAYVEESEATAISRYLGFAFDFFERLYAAHPRLRDRFRFFRDVHTDDLWSVCDATSRHFGIQLDPDIEVICLWDADYQDEIGSWHEDPVAYAIDEIRERYLLA